MDEKALDRIALLEKELALLKEINALYEKARALRQPEYYPVYPVNPYIYPYTAPLVYYGVSGTGTIGAAEAVTK